MWSWQEEADEDADDDKSVVFAFLPLVPGVSLDEVTDAAISTAILLLLDPEGKL
jgi:hypothetical protein